ncbi:hypothetical protein N7454_005588 [Penicillium verhagenii]|nr:hypothetical protein N7454_005588 [Penicillium verhagenii]
MSSTPPINLPAWQVTIGIFLSVTFLILIEKLFGIHVNIRFNKGTAMATFPGWAQILGPGETQVALLHRWIDAHRNPAAIQQTPSAQTCQSTLTPHTTQTAAQNSTQNTAQHIGYSGTFKSKQLMVDA